MAVDKTSNSEEFVCLLEDCSLFDKLLVRRSVLYESFNMDNEPNPEDIHQCMPFTAIVKVKGMTIIECDILTVPEKMGLSTVDDSSEETGIDGLSTSLSDNTLI